jgi:hypothetical protein
MLRPSSLRYQRQDQGRALKASTSLAAVGASGGPGAALAELLGMVGRGVIEEAQADEARIVAEQSTAAGLQAGREAGDGAAAAMAEGGSSVPAAIKLREGDTVSAHAFNKALLASYVSRLDLSMEEQAAKFAAEHKDDPASFMAKWEGTTRGVLNTMPPHVQAEVEGELRRKGLRYLHPIIRAKRDSEIYAVNADLIKNGEDYATRAVSSFRSGDIEGGGEWGRKFFGTLANRTDLTQEQRDKISQSFHDDRRNQTALGMFERELAVGPDRARRFLSDLTNPAAHPEWHPADREKLGRHMEALVRDRESEIDRQRREAERAAEEKRSHWLSDFQIGLHRGERTYADIETAYQSGRLRDHERTSAVLLLDARNEREADAVAELGRVGAAIGGNGLAMDPRSEKDRKAIDAHFSATSAGWKNLSPGEVWDRTLSYAAQPGVGMLPSPVKAQVRGWLRAGTPEQKVAAADMVAKIRTANPQLLNDLSEEDLSMGNLVGDYTSSGVRPEEAVRLAEEAMRAPKAEREARAEQYRELGAKAPAADHLTRELNGSWLYRALPGPNPQLPPEMVEEYDRLARAEYQRHGNWDAARKTATDNLRRVWGVSTLSDGPKWMKGAPETFYGLPGMEPAENGKWMREQLAGDLLSSGGMFDPGAGPIEKRVILAPDPYSRTDKGTGLPVYAVMLKAPDGRLNPVLGSDGRPLPWRPDWGNSPEAKRREAERTRRVDEARAARAGRGEVMPMETP